MEPLTLHTVTEKHVEGIFHGSTVPYTFRYECADFSDGTQITSYSYVADRTEDSRPAVFVTNGGPGSGVCWQHLGFFGPRIIDLEDEVNPRTIPPFHLIDNPKCLLDQADFILMDPPGTGYSKLSAEHAKDYESIDGDAGACALFMEKWLISHHRVNSPVYFIGESYGTVRGPAILNILYGGPFQQGSRLAAINMAGMFLIGTAFNAGDYLKPSPVEECVLNLPSCAATYAWHQKKDPFAAFNEALNFGPDYVSLLYRGNEAGEQERADAAEEISSLTGIPEETLLESKLRFTIPQFASSCVPGKTVGTYDGRYVMDGSPRPGTFPFPGMTDPVADDPAMGKYSPAFTAAQYLFAREMGLPDDTYRMIDFAVNGAFDYKSRHTCMGSLENAMRRNPSFRVEFAHGLYDLCVMAGAMLYDVRQSGLDPARTKTVLYPSGHMVYVGSQSSALLERQLREFLR